MTPLLSYLFFKPAAGTSQNGGQTQSADPYGGLAFRAYRGLLVAALRFRWFVVLLAAGLFAMALFGFTKIDQSFFPPATRPQFIADHRTGAPPPDVPRSVRKSRRWNQ